MFPHISENGFLATGQLISAGIGQGMPVCLHFIFRMCHVISVAVFFRRNVEDGGGLIENVKIRCNLFERWQ